METVFDLATPQELAALLGENRKGEPEHPFTTFHDLALLFASRGDLKKAEHYLAQIDDPQYRLDCQLLINEGRDDESTADDGETVLFTAH